MDRVLHPGPERRHRGHARPRLHARRHRPGPCFQDYPHIGATRNGVYISTNEYDLFGPGYSAAQIYALSKAELAAHGPSDPRDVGREPERRPGRPGFTVWPATSPAGRVLEPSATAPSTSCQHDRRRRQRDRQPDGHRPQDRRVGVDQHAVARLGDAERCASASRLINSQTYVFPPTSDQKPGDFPLGRVHQRHDDRRRRSARAAGSSSSFGDEPAARRGHLDTRLARHPHAADLVRQRHAVGRVGHRGAGRRRDQGRDRLVRGPAACVKRPARSPATWNKQGYIALANNNLTMPAIAVTPAGQGAIAFTVMGEDHHPSAAYVAHRRPGRVGPIHIAAEGCRRRRRLHQLQGVRRRPAAPHTRWGDYGAAVTDGDDDLDRVGVHRPDLHAAQ